MLHMRGQQGGAKSNFKETMKRRTPGWCSIRVRQSTRDTKRVLVICRDTDVMLLLVHFIPAQTAEVWMISGTAKKRKCYPIHPQSERLEKPLRDNLLGFHAFTGCDTTSAFSGRGKRSCWTTFQNLPHFLQGIGRDGELVPLNNLYIICTAHLSNKPSTMPDSNSSVRASLVWRCYPQPETPWNFTPHAPTIKQRSGCRQTRNI